MYLTIVVSRFIIKVQIQVIQIMTMYIIVQRHKQKFNQYLFGDGLGNPHVDLSMDGAVTGTYGVESLCLGTNTYTDILESTDKGGNTINS